MLPIYLHVRPNEDFNKYEDAITHLAANTITYYGGQEYRPRGNFMPSYDVSQVCCWISEQPLRNGMRLCTINNRSSQIAIIEEPAKEEAGEMVAEEVFPHTSPYDLLLISPDCHDGLQKSLDYLDIKQLGQKLIKDPQNPNEYVTDPLNYKHYIWPNYLTAYPEMDGVHDILLGNLNALPTISQDLRYRAYNSQECFIYTRKTALVQYLVTKEIENEDDEDMDIEKEKPLDVGAETLKEFIFIEANPALPKPLYVMAENTIRLFRLNSRFYDHLNSNKYHCIEYNTSNSEQEYDDLRLEGRMQAYKRARKSLTQLKTMQTIMADTGLLQTFINQYKTLMELTGYTSVWATVFTDGNDPGSFNDIMGTPAPVAPVSPVPIDVDGPQDILDVNNPEEVIEEIEEIVEECKGEQAFSTEAEKVVVNKKRLHQNITDAAKNDNNWERPTKKQKRDTLPGSAKDDADMARVLTDGSITCSSEFLKLVNAKLAHEKKFCNFPSGIIS